MDSGQTTRTCVFSLCRALLISRSSGLSCSWAPEPSVLDSVCYNDTWPLCVQLPKVVDQRATDATLRPYGPFGKDNQQSYCLPVEGDQCPFKEMVYPAQEVAKSLELDGDAPGSFQIWAAESRSHGRRFAKTRRQRRHAVPTDLCASQWCSH